MYYGLKFSEENMIFVFERSFAFLIVKKIVGSMSFFFLTASRIHLLAVLELAKFVSFLGFDFENCNFTRSVE